MLTKLENTIKSWNDIGDNVLVVQRQQEETQLLISQLANKEPDYKDVIAIAQTVNDDPLVEDSEARSVEQEANSLSVRWVSVNEALKGRSER